jgi:hypothetical protein
MSFPKIGMHFEDVRKRVKRISSGKESDGAKRLVGSLINQARLAEGEGAVKEIIGELAFSGSSNRQSGIGSGKFLGGGRWRYAPDTGWQKID